MRVQMPRRAATALFVTIAVASCGGRTDPTSSSIKVRDFRAEVIRTFCENFGACCESAGNVLGNAVSCALGRVQDRRQWPAPLVHGSRR